ncbi:MAG: hypothetical protein J6U20_04030 [Fibrobacter sp.]|nr:hypothetical protein [Fibrobacter sp.]
MMTKTIDELRHDVINAEKRYGNRCRRLYALNRAGRTPSGKCWNAAEAMRLRMERAMQDLDLGIKEEMLTAIAEGANA